MHNLPNEARNEIIRNYREYKAALAVAITAGGLIGPEARAVRREYSNIANIYRELKAAERGR